MNKEQLLEVAKQIRFNTEMVRAILDGRKTVTRRVVKPQPIWIADPNIPFKTPDANPKGIIKPPYSRGDILYVRETWQNGSFLEDDKGKIVDYIYKADDTKDDNSYSDWGIKWKPSIHMPKEAARIFLKVTDIRVERLWDITPEQIIAEGECSFSTFSMLWDSKIKKQDIDLYGLGANPWTWVIEFERMEVDQ